MFGFNRNRAKYEYCELIESDLDKLYQKAEHLKSIGYENTGNGAFFNSDNNQYRITMRKINSLPRKFGDYGKKKEKNDDEDIAKIFVLGFFYMFLVLIIFIAIRLNANVIEEEREKIINEARQILNEAKHYQSLCNKAKDNNSRGAK
ncbi:hypothetical protein LS77_011520 [Helicobacter bilis]|uniref:Uncharacterized protein n=2 Tax=Helicobacter bilis TaxID=37372 RepID=A0A6D2C3F2_9HELI|nr:hypothetical protein [Helicobacter bilis]EMZ37544.1 hypothetical protein C826_02110 [Helicobacter bilis WiWa]TLE01208.1 hypothetical protein LS77_011520 [Helicobacter bilis]TLE02382.1 hypothetical protein LS76_011490 [Helicobacter bilis]